MRTSINPSQRGDSFRLIRRNPSSPEIPGGDNAWSASLERFRPGNRSLSIRPGRPRAVEARGLKAAGTPPGWLERVRPSPGATSPGDRRRIRKTLWWFARSRRHRTAGSRAARRRAIWRSRCAGKIGSRLPRADPYLLSCQSTSWRY